jgi:hypothetical protein
MAAKAPRPNPANRTNGTLLGIRATFEEREKVRRAAEAKGLTISEMVRRGLALQGVAIEP